jgi:hypothetical protein
MPVLVSDIFNGDNFSNISMTSFVNSNIPFYPGLLSSMNLFSAEGVYTKYVSFDEQAGALKMIQTSPRGSPPSQADIPRASSRVMQVVHLAREVEVNADELLAMRAAGGLTLQTAQGLLAQRVDGPIGLRSQINATMEHLYLGAIDGQVYDADGTSLLYDWFTFFGVARPTAINIAVSTMGVDTTVLIAAGTAVRRAMILAMQGMPMGGGQVVALCGDNFFDAITQCKEVTQARKLGATGMGVGGVIEALTPLLPYDSIRFAGITWINYRGSDDGLIAIPTAGARLFMTGVPGLFQSFFAPADTFETISAVGLPYYLLQRSERQTDSRRVFELQSNPLVACMRPRSLLRMTFS